MCVCVPRGVKLSGTVFRFLKREQSNVAHGGADAQKQNFLHVNAHKRACVCARVSKGKTKIKNPKHVR